MLPHLLASGLHGGLDPYLHEFPFRFFDYRSAWSPAPCAYLQLHHILALFRTRLRSLGNIQNGALHCFRVSWWHLLGYKQASQELLARQHANLVDHLSAKDGQLSEFPTSSAAGDQQGVMCPSPQTIHCVWVENDCEGPDIQASRWILQENLQLVLEVPQGCHGLHHVHVWATVRVRAKQSAFAPSANLPLPFHLSFMPGLLYLYLNIFYLLQSLQSLLQA